MECEANLGDGSKIAARKAVESLQVRLGGGDTQVPLVKLIPSDQIYELEEILDTYCR